MSKLVLFFIQGGIVALTMIPIGLILVGLMGISLGVLSTTLIAVGFSIILFYSMYVRNKLKQKKGKS